MSAAQGEHRIRITTPLGPDVLLFRKMQARERVSQLYEFTVDAFSKNLDIHGKDLLGLPVTVSFTLPGTSERDRHFHGLVSQFSFDGTSGTFAQYRLRLSPWLWFLTRTRDSRIFQEKTVPVILKQIFQEHGVGGFEDRLSGQYRTWNYCVQYRETDFHFVSRLMELEGIYYFFIHEKEKHTLVLADSYSAHTTAAGYERVPYYPPEDTHIRERDFIDTWRDVQEVKPGNVTLWDHNFETPQANLEGRLSRALPHALASFEVYDYPGGYVNSDEGASISRLRLESLQADHVLTQGSGNVAGLVAGNLFTLTNHPRTDENIEYLLLETTMVLETDTYASGGNAGEVTCTCAFAAAESNRPFRPALVTRKPFVQGPQTAVVTGPAGAEIHTDKYGRVKVQFHWDREGKRDQDSSCWVRVSQLWAGKSWGGIAIPRIGQEVIVDFLEGDPDRPIITGRVYNASAMPPYGLPGAAVISGVKSDSTKGGGGYNEYVMDDTKGTELIREHGQYDKDSTIEHDLREHVLHCRSRDVTVDETISIGEDQSQTIGRNQTEKIGNDQSFTIGHNQTGSVGVDKSLRVGANHTENIGANMTITIGSNLTETVAINHAETVGAAMELTIGATMTETVGAAKTQSIGSNKSETIGANKSVDVGADQSVSVGAKQTVSIGSDKSEQVGGNKTIKVAKDLKEEIDGQHLEQVTKDYGLKAKKITIEADDEIQIKTGSAIIEMKKNGDISINGKKITIKGSGDVIIKGSKILEN